MFKLKGKFETMAGKKWFRMRRPVITQRKEGEVTFSVGYRYNGGIIINGKHVQGILIASPKVPKGFELRSIGVGLQLNSRPPYATQFLKKTS